MIKYILFPGIEKCEYKSRHTIFVVSLNTIEFQSAQAHAFTMAHIKTDKNINNHLIIVFRGKTTNILLDENLENYFQKYVMSRKTKQMRKNFGED